MTKIKMQCRDSKGNLLAYNQDVLTLVNAMAIKLQWEQAYGTAAHCITINFFHA